ncbi:MAG: (2Fe-2S)-binding protein [Spirochaetales bacterium]|nr:(2Fe-2S)-binding protein [Spirochaetales bacterium]
MTIEFILNNKKVKIESPAYQSLLDILRIDFNLMGTKSSCRSGECGACLVLVNRDLVNSCLYPAFKVHNKEVLTIEGLASLKEYQIYENAFTELEATNCGFCTPALIMATEGLLSHNNNPSDEEIKDALSGNICLCTGYDKILLAVKEAAKLKRKKKNVR